MATLYTYIYFFIFQGSHWILLKELEAKLDDLEEYYNIILNFHEPTLQERHWNNLKYILELPSDESINFFQSAKFNFEFLQNLKTDNLIQKTSVIAMQARKEYELEQVSSYCNSHSVLCKLQLDFQFCHESVYS